MGRKRDMPESVVEAKRWTRNWSIGVVGYCLALLPAIWLSNTVGVEPLWVSSRCGAWVCTWRAWALAPT